jgi:hypothetical protein
MQIYIAGPVTKVPGKNRAAFDLVADQLRDRGHTPIVPHEHVPSNARWDLCMKALIPLMLQCDAVAALRGWQQSKGALIEVHLAIDVGMPIYFEAAEGGFSLARIEA